MLDRCILFLRHRFLWVLQLQVPVPLPLPLLGRILVWAQCRSSLRAPALAYLINRGQADFDVDVVALDEGTNVRVYLGTSSTPVSTSFVGASSHHRFDLSAASTTTVRVQSDKNILVTVSAAPSSYDYTILPPAALEVVGAPGASTVRVTCTEASTTAIAYRSDGSSLAKTCGAGGTFDITGFASYGAGPALKIVSNKPIGAMANGDGDGSDAHALLPLDLAYRNTALPEAAAYVAIATVTPGATVKLYQPDGTLANTYTAPGSNVGKLLLSNIGAGYRIESSARMVAMYDSSTGTVETDLFGYNAELTVEPHDLSAVAWDFDDFEGGPGSGDDWNLRNSVNPVITTDEANNGDYSLYYVQRLGPEL